MKPEEMTRPALTPEMEFYAEWDDEYNMYFIYDTEEGFAWRNCVGQKEAERIADEMTEANKKRFTR